MNFIVDLLITSKNFNCLTTITNRFSKYIRLIFEKKIWEAKKWVDQYHRHIYKFWDLLTRIIIDRDSRFVNKFLFFLFQKFEVKLNLIIAYNFKFDNQFERTNQTIKTIIRCLLINRYEKNWIVLFVDVKYALNTAKNAFTNTTLFEMLYDVKFREMFFVLTISKKYDWRYYFSWNACTASQQNLQRY